MKCSWMAMNFSVKQMKIEGRKKIFVFMSCDKIYVLVRYDE